MDVLVTGSHGFIAGALVPRLRAHGHRVVRLVRGGVTGDDELSWDPDADALDASSIEGLDAVVHLAGAGIGDQRWTPERKRVVLESRTRGTGLLARTLAGLDDPPAVLVSSSAVGYYGNRGDELLTEESSSGHDFLADVCVAWEAATTPAADAGIRVVNVRTGVVLTRHGGVLKRLLLPFKLGVGGRIGSGKQYLSWVCLDDTVGAIVHVLANDDVRGPVNVAAPNPSTNAEFTAALGRVLRRPTLLPTPLAPLKVLYGGELVQSLLVDGQRVSSAKLAASSYEFAQPELDAALRAVLHAPEPA